MENKDLCEHTRIRLIAAALGHQQCTKTDGTEVLIPGTDKRILIGGDAYLAKVALPAAPASAQPAEDALRKLCDQLDGMKRRMRHTPGTGQNHSYLLREDVEAYVEEARKALAAPQQPAARVAVPDEVQTAMGMLKAFRKGECSFPSSMFDIVAHFFDGLAASPATVAAPAQADWCKECVGQGIDTDPPEPGADDTCRACNGSGLATVNEPATAGMVGPDQEHVNRIVSDEDKTALLSIVKDLEWSVNGTFIVTKSGDQMHTLDALAFARVARAYRAGMVGRDAKDAAPPFQLDPHVTYVCAERDIECGGRAANWCEKCPKRRAALAAQQAQASAKEGDQA